MARKFRTLNPANKNRTLETIRFRGLIASENEASVPNNFVGASDNLTSFKLREMTVRDGAQDRVDYLSGIIAGKRTLNQIVMGEGPNLYVSPIDERLVPTKQFNFIRPIITEGI